MHSAKAERRARALRRRLRRVGWASLCLAAWWMPVAGSEAAQSASAVLAAADDPAGRAQHIEAGVQALRADPLLSGRRTTHTLRWISDEDEPLPATATSWIRWIAAFARFLGDTSRFLVYGLAIVLVALLLVSLRHFVHLRGRHRRTKAAAAISHVHDLDVRPDSLPEDVGAAAWTLWQAGRTPAALSLLYRGALSRLIHRHGVMITAATTEGECLALAKGRIGAPAHRYLSQVVRAWEARTYGNRTLSMAMGEALCTGFASRLDAPGASPTDDAPPVAGAAP